MKVVVTGVCGQLGHDVMAELLKRGYDGIGSDVCDHFFGIKDGRHGTIMPYVSMDITNHDDVIAKVCAIMPDVIIHCAAWTAVDAAEDENNKPTVYKINVEGTRNIAEAAKEVGAKMAYLSTDYVFNGQGVEPWKPDDKNYAPLNYYGQTKLEGELAVASILRKFFIVRIAWVFGLNGKNFVKTMVNAGRSHEVVRVVDDQIGTPTYTRDLARLLVDMIETDKYGYYHATNEGGYISWYDFTCEIYQIGRAHV